MRNYFLLVIFGLCSVQCFTQNNYEQHWEISDKASIGWDLDQTQNLPHTDNIEMAGKRVVGIVSYSIDTNKLLTLERQVFFPQFHPYIKDTDPSWFVYRAYFKNTFDDSSLPKLFVKDKQLTPGPVRNVSIDGRLTFEHETSKEGVKLTRSLYPSMDDRLFVEQWTLTNESNEAISFKAANSFSYIEDLGEKGKFVMQSRSEVEENFTLEPNEVNTFLIKYQAKLNQEEFPKVENETANNSRSRFIEKMAGSLNLETPDQTLNTLFEFSKIRASESIFESELGLIHSPGGGRYYVGIWANDQAEYISPFFPFLGYDVGNETAMNTYRAFATKTSPNYEMIPYAFEVENREPPNKIDRGDAAMIAYGASQFALANGSKAEGKELWPLIEWCLEYSKRQINKEGVVKSDSDEMEGRIETGTANLSTSALYYGALLHAADLAEALGKSPRKVKKYRKQARKLNQAIENYFGAEVEGLNTYKYYKEHKYLRHWVCLPLVVGINDRKEATTEALFERLWSPNGVHVEKNSDNEAITKVFWDRGTLYALRGTFLAGATDRSLEKLQQFSEERLLGKRVPYVVEAFPEGNMAHLSAESGLYCRVFTEGLFAIRPTGLDRFTCQPRLPSNWNEMALRNIKAFNQNFDIEVQRVNGKHSVKLLNAETGDVISEKMSNLDEPIEFKF